MSAVVVNLPQNSHECSMEWRFHTAKTHQETNEQKYFPGTHRTPSVPWNHFSVMENRSKTYMFPAGGKRVCLIKATTPVRKRMERTPVGVSFRGQAMSFRGPPMTFALQGGSTEDENCTFISAKIAISDARVPLPVSPLCPSKRLHCS